MDPRAFRTPIKSPSTVRKAGADWLAWGFQFVLGGLVGLALGLFVIARRGRSRTGFWMDSEFVLIWVTGAVLVGGALASYFGDRLWIGRSYLVIPPDRPRHSALSRHASRVVGMAGALFMGRALFGNFGIL
jgi:hypothetical protein